MAVTGRSAAKALPANAAIATLSSRPFFISFPLMRRRLVICYGGDGQGSSHSSLDGIVLCGRALGRTKEVRIDILQRADENADYGHEDALRELIHLNRMEQKDEYDGAHQDNDRYRKEALRVGHEP